MWFIEISDGYDVDLTRAKCTSMTYVCTGIILLFWFYLSNTRAFEYTQKTYDMTLVTLTDGRVYQTAIIDDKMVNVTEILSAIYPDGFKLIKRTHNRWKFGIYYIEDPGCSYIVIDENESEYETKVRRESP